MKGVSKLTTTGTTWRVEGEGGTARALEDKVKEERRHGWWPCTSPVLNTLGESPLALCASVPSPEHGHHASVLCREKPWTNCSSPAVGRRVRAPLLCWRPAEVCSAGDTSRDQGTVRWVGELWPISPHLKEQGCQSYRNLSVGTAPPAGWKGGNFQRKISSHSCFHMVVLELNKIESIRHLA